MDSLWLTCMTGCPSASYIICLLLAFTSLNTWISMIWGWHALARVWITVKCYSILNYLVDHHIPTLLLSHYNRKFSIFWISNHHWTLRSPVYLILNLGSSKYSACWKCLLDLLNFLLIGVWGYTCFHFILNFVPLFCHLSCEDVIIEN